MQVPRIGGKGLRGVHSAAPLIEMLWGSISIATTGWSLEGRRRNILIAYVKYPNLSQCLPDTCDEDAERADQGIRGGLQACCQWFCILFSR